MLRPEGGGPLVIQGREAHDAALPSNNLTTTKRLGFCLHGVGQAGDSPTYSNNHASGGALLGKVSQKSIAGGRGGGPPSTFNQPPVESLCVCNGGCLTLACHDSAPPQCCLWSQPSFQCLTAPPRVCGHAPGPAAGVSTHAGSFPSQGARVSPDTRPSRGCGHQAHTCLPSDDRTLRSLCTHALSCTRGPAWPRKRGKQQPSSPGFKPIMCVTRHTERWVPPCVRANRAGPAQDTLQAAVQLGAVRVPVDRHVVQRAPDVPEPMAGAGETERCAPVSLVLIKQPSQTHKLV